MPETLLARTTDTEFSRQVGIVPDLKPRISGARKLLLAFSLLLAGSTTLFAVMFQAGSTTESKDLRTGVTQCPMAKPSR